MRFRRVGSSILAAMVILATAQSAVAGMPSVSFNDVASSRLQTISFFLLGFLLSSAVILVVWNRFAQDFPRLPRLTFFKACGVVLLWGLLFVVVLTMISGARELMTPGAWKKNSATYKLRESDTVVSASEIDDATAIGWRRERLARLGESLRQYAHEHDGTFPANREVSGVDERQWLLPEANGLRYVYIPGRTLDSWTTPVAYEPEFDDGDVLVLLVSGQVQAVSRERLREMLGEATR